MLPRLVETSTYSGNKISTLVADGYALTKWCDLVGIWMLRVTKNAILGHERQAACTLAVATIAEVKKQMPAKKVMS